MGDRAQAAALGIATEMANKENAGNRYLVAPERVGEIAAIILNSLQSNLKEGGS